MSNIYKNTIDVYKQDAEHYRTKYIDALHTISLRDEEIEGLKAELSQLKADCKHDAKVCDDYDDDLIKECHELQAENDKLNDALKTSSSHYPKEYNQEAEEYFNHNPNEEKLFFFMVGGSGVDEDGDVIDTLNVGVDAIAECDNFKGVISVETYD